MSGYARFAVPLMLSFNFAYATPDVTGTSGGSGQPSNLPVKAQTRELVDQNGCTISLTTGKRDIYNPIKEIDGLEKDSLEDMLTNGIIRLYGHQFSPVPSKNQEMLNAELEKLAERVAEFVFSNEFLATRDGQMQVQDWLSTRSGALPVNLLDSLTSGLDAAVSETRNREARPPYAVEGDNAIAAITQELTSFQKQAMDVNGLANRASNLGGNWLIQKVGLGRVFKTAGTILREEFQSVNDVIAANDRALLMSIAGHRKSQRDLYEARIELTSIAKYLQAAEHMLLHLKEIANARVQGANLSAEENQAITQYVLDPITKRTQFIQRDSSQVMAAYVNFAGIMDFQLNVIALMENFRGSIAFQVRTAGYGKLAMNSLEQSMSAMKNAQAASDLLLKTSLEQMRAIGVQIREFPEFMFESQEKTLLVVQGMINEITVARESMVNNEKTSQERLQKFSQQLADMRVKSGVVDMVSLADKFIDQTQGQKSNVLKALPPPGSIYPADMTQQLVAQ